MSAISKTLNELRLIFIISLIPNWKPEALLKKGLNYFYTSGREGSIYYWINSFRAEANFFSLNEMNDA